MGSPQLLWGFIFGNPETKRCAGPKFNIAELMLEIITCTMSAPNITKLNVTPVPPLMGMESTLYKNMIDHPY